MTSIDAKLSSAAIAAGENAPALWTAARRVTELGGAPVLWVVMLLGAVLLWRRGARRHAIIFLATTISGRISVEILKAAIARPRPDAVDHPVFVHSLSMPSGHAANSMLVYLSLALLLAPASPRARAVAAAVTLSVLIGLTRPILGVHWPTDVLAGWLWGAGWTLVAVALSRRWLEGDRARPPSPAT